MSRYFAPAKGWNSLLRSNPPVPAASYAQLITGFSFSNGDQTWLQVSTRQALDATEREKAVQAVTKFMNARQSRIQIVFTAPAPPATEHSFSISICDLSVKAMSDLAVCLTKAIGASAEALDANRKPVIRSGLYTTPKPTPDQPPPRAPVFLHIMV